MSKKFEIPKEMYDFIKVMEMGAAKHGANNWLDADGKKSSERDMHDSLFHHLSQSYAEAQISISFCKKFPTLTKLEDEFRRITDDESGLDPLLHVACRALMLYTRRQRGIVHKDDKPGESE